jgi:hypothetical protein
VEAGFVRLALHLRSGQRHVHCLESFTAFCGFCFLHYEIMRVAQHMADHAYGRRVAAFEFDVDRQVGFRQIQRGAGGLNGFLYSFRQRILESLLIIRKVGREFWRYDQNLERHLIVAGKTERLFQTFCFITGSAADRQDVVKLLHDRLPVTCLVTVASCVPACL